MAEYYFEVALRDGTRVDDLVEKASTYQISDDGFVRFFDIDPVSYPRIAKKLLVIPIDNLGYIALRERGD